jgi:hypothetical protein
MISAVGGGKTVLYSAPQNENTRPRRMVQSIHFSVDTQGTHNSTPHAHSLH